MRVESYVIRIYRRSGTKRRAVIGIIEAAGSGWQKPFRNLEELAEILAKPHARPREYASRDRPSVRDSLSTSTKSLHEGRSK